MNFVFPATALALTLSLFSITGHAAPRTTVDIDGNGLIEINDLADLNEIRKNLEGKALYGSSQGCPADGCVGFELKANLDFDTNGDGKIDANDEYWNNGEGWEPIGSSSSNAFKAVFEGNGHVIRNLNINRAFYVGLFGYADNATIRRVGLTGTLTQITGQSYVGGVLGYGTATHLQGVFASGILLSSSTSSTRMGGVAGYLTSNSTIEDSFSTASVTAKYTWVGGLVGNLYNSTVNRAFSTGRVSNDGATTYTGGLIGYASSSTVTQSYWATDSSGQSRSNGTSNSNPSYFGITLAELGCTSAPNNTSCVSGKILFENWPTDATANNGIAWVFDGNGLPALSLNGKQYRDRDGDGYLDQDDQWPDDYAAAVDADGDGHPDRWTLGCDDECVANSGLTLDMFPETAAAWQDDDLDGFPDDWAAGCDVSCQKASGLILDTHLNDQHNGNPPAGIVIVDADHNGLIEIETLEQLDAIRYNLEGTGLVLTAGGKINVEGCPPRLINGQMQRLCKGYELKADLDFDTNGDGKIDANDEYWNNGEGWQPFGNYASGNAFRAIFEGNGHVIRNLYINRPNTDYIGLFGYADNATIRRVGLTGTLTQITGRSYVGGVLGYGKATHLQGVFASGAVSSSYNTNNTYMGGVAGYLMYSTIEDSFSTASVTAKNDRVGGLVGYLSNSAINRTFSTGRVYSDSTSFVSGLIGYAYASAVAQSYWAIDSSGQSSSYGTSSSNSSYFGITLAELGCASAPNNTSCVSGKTLFENWPTGAAANDGIAWVFDGNGLPALSLNGKQYRDRDGDGYLDQDDQWPDNYAAAIDFDKDGYPDRWTLGCDDECVANSGLTLDMFPETAAAWQDDDMDGFPDSWADDCDEDCQNASDLTLDPDPLDPYNGTPPDGIVIIDADHNGLIDIHTLDDLNAIRYNLEGTGLKLSANDENNSEGCPPRLVNGQMQRLCRGYELKADLDFDTNGDGKIDANDKYWNNGAGWIPIGNYSSAEAFRAIFEGNGHVIRNLYINRPITSYVGLFGHANNATIRRVGLTGTLTQITGRSEIGGILGYGIATHLQGVFASGALSSAYTSNAYMGGVAGYLTSNSTIEDSFSTVSVTAKSSYSGGLVGYLSNSAVNRTFSTGRVYSDLGSNIGGLIGYASSNIITQSYWAIDSSGQSSSYGASNSNSSSYFGVTLAELGCATSPDDTNCVSGKTLFENWPTDATANNGIAWVFDGNGLPALSLNGKQHRDRDGDGYLDQDDQWPDDYAAAIDFDKDGHPDRWTLGCDDECVTNSGLTLDMFPETAAAWQDDDLDGLPDSWAVGCDVGCQNASGLTLDTHLNDHHNGNPPDGIVIVDADHNGLIEIETLEQLDAIRYNLEGTGLKLSANDENNSEGCPPRLVNGQMQRLCKGYELKKDLDFDINDDYWNDGEGWEPIGSSSNAFKAVFEGNGHVIRNLYINRPNASYIGLFGYANNATIRRVGLTGTLTQITGRSYVGGVLGYGKATHLQGVFVSGVLSSAYTSNAYMGGVAGYLELNSTIEDSVSTANVTAKSKEVGGLVGNLYNSTVNRAFSTGRVYSDETSYVGGLIGYESSSTVTQSYWATDSSGQSRSNGTSNSNPSYFGITLAELGCATSSNNTSCVSGKTLFEKWPTNATANNGIAWVFDNTQLVPSLQINGVLHRDNDLDKDGIPNDQDAFPNNPAASVDIDGDGYPDKWNDSCDINCQQNSGLTLDAFPANPAAAIDTDGDGYPDKWSDSCGITCQQNSGLTLDAFPNNPAAAIDADGDGYPDSWNEGCDVTCQQNSGLKLDAYPNDFDNDGVPDLLDPDNNADNGAPEMQTVPSEMHVAVDTTGVVGLLKYSDLLTELKAFDAVDGNDLTYQATANGALLEIQTIDDEPYLVVPVGLQVVQWTAKDKSGNQSEPMEQIVNVYPQIGFVKSESITGENSGAGIEMYLSGVSPVYPLDVELEFDLDLENSTLSQADVAAINLSEIQTVQFLAGSTSAKLTINVLSDDEPEADETLLVRLIKAKTNSEENSYFTFNSDLKEHVLTVTEENLPPVVLLSVYQAGKEVSEVNWEQGDVTIEASIHDPNGNDSHTIAWDLSDLPHALVDEAKVSFSPDRLAGGDYSIAITVTDDGQPPLFAEAQLDIRINRPVVDEKPASTPSKKKKRGSFPWPVLTVLVAAYAMRKLRHKGHAA